MRQYQEVTYLCSQRERRGEGERRKGAEKNIMDIMAQISQIWSKTSVHKYKKLSKYQVG